MPTPPRRSVLRPERMEDRLAPARYELTPGAFSWAQAQSIAVSRGGNLVTINDAAEEAAIQAQFGTGVSYWIGLSDAKTEGQFVWADGQVTSYRDWEAGEPNDFGGSEDYAVMNFGPARKWNDVGNGEIKYGVIEIPDGTSPPPTSPPPTSPPPTSPPPTSPPPTSPPPGSYALTSRSLTWPQAQAEAASRGGNLVTVNSAAEEAALQAQFGTSTVFWIGLSDAKTEGQFAWADGQVTAYRNWEAGEPNNYGGDEDYAGMNYGPARKWNDIGSNTYNYGIIEFPSVQPGTVGLRSSVVDVSEAGGRADLIIDRTGGSAGTITVDYRTVAGTSAAAGADYTAASGTLTFGPGETTKTVSVPILNDALVEGTETFGFAIDNVTGGGTLGAPRTATVNIQDDESPLTTLFAFTSLTDPAAVSLNGPARLVGGAVRLTEATNQAGSAFHPRPLEVTANTSFAARFSFRITGGTGGADGLTFAVHNAAAGSRALGGPGGSLGYAGIDASLAVEFDTYQNAGDANANAVSVLQNGNTTAPLVTAASPVDLNGGQRVYAWVDYDGAANRLDVFVSNAATKPTSALLTRTVDLATVVGPRAFVGFTSGTGGLSNVHEIIDWTLAANSRLLPAPSTGVVTRESVASGFVQPTALDWTPDGRNLYVAEQRGVIRVLRDGVLQTTPFLDFTDRVNGTRDRGLLDIAVHPQFPTQPYVYLLYTYDPPEVYQNSSHPLAGPDKSGNRAGRLTRVTANAATNYTTIVANSEVVLVGRNSTWANFNGFVDSTDNFTEPPAGIRPDGTNVPDFIATDSQSHTVGAIEFGTDGLLYATIGDGTSYNRVDPRTVRVQDVNNLSGKVLRIDPLTGNGVSSNPFWNGDAAANRSKVYQLGLRNGFRTAIDRQTNRLYVGDVGWTAWEEINAAGPGANFGWPYYEGGSGNSLRTGGYQDLSQAQAFYAAGTPVTPSLLALNHAADGINAIVMGDVYRATAYPAEFQGNIFFNDLGQGIVRAARINASGGLDNVRTFTTGATYVVAMKVGPDGLLYFVDLDDGTVGRWRVG